MSDYLAGAKLAASISPAQRIDMVQRGYSPMNPKDVENYINHKPPTGSMLTISTAVLEEGTSMNSFGEKHMSYEKDYRQVAAQFENQGANIDELENITPRNIEKVNPKSEMAERLGDYGSGERSGERRDVNERLGAALGKKKLDENQPQKRVLQKTVPQKNSLLIDMPRSDKEYITEAKDAQNIGYKRSCNYLNAFIANIKAPSYESRVKLIKEINNMVSTEAQIHPSILKEYRKGVATAELELYNNIMKKKNNG